MVACGSTMMQDLEKSKREYAPLLLSEMFWDALFLCHQGGGCHPSHIVPCHHNCHDHWRSWRLPHTCPLHSIEAIWKSTQTPVYTPNCPTNSKEILVLPFMHIGKYNFGPFSILMRVMISFQGFGFSITGRSIACAIYLYMTTQSGFLFEQFERI